MLVDPAQCWQSSTVLDLSVCTSILFRGHYINLVILLKIASKFHIINCFGQTLIHICIWVANKMLYSFLLSCECLFLCTFGWSVIATFPGDTHLFLGNQLQSKMPSSLYFNQSWLTIGHFHYLPGQKSGNTCAKMFLMLSFIQLNSGRKW